MKVGVLLFLIVSNVRKASTMAAMRKNLCYQTPVHLVSVRSAFNQEENM